MYYILNSQGYYIYRCYLHHVVFDITYAIIMQSSIVLNWSVKMPEVYN